MHPLFFIVVLLCGGLAAYFAHQKGRRPELWFVIGLLLGIWGVLLVLLMPAPKTNQTASTQNYDTPDVIEVEGEVVKNESRFEGKDWFYLDRSDLQQGPITFSYMRSLWKKGTLSLSTAVWYEEMKDWKPILAVEGLKDALEA